MVAPPNLWFVFMAIVLYEFDGQSSIYDMRMIFDLACLFFLSTLYTGRRFFFFTSLFCLYISFLAFVNNTAFIAFKHLPEAFFFLARVLEPAVFGWYYVGFAAGSWLKEGG